MSDTETINGNVTTYQQTDQYGNLINEEVITTDGNQKVEQLYDGNLQLINTAVTTTNPDGSYVEEQFDPQNHFLGGSINTVIDNGQYYETLNISYDSNWVMNGANITVTSDAHPADITWEEYGPNWQMIIAYDSTTTQIGDLTTVIKNQYDANWNVVTHFELFSDVVAGNYLNVYNGTVESGLAGGGSANWNIDGVAGSETWAAGTHKVSLTETANPGTALPLVTLTDVTLDNTGTMTSAKILTFGIQGQAFMQTEEDYDSSWHLTSWHGTGPAYDQTVNYTVGSTSA